MKGTVKKKGSIVIPMDLVRQILTSLLSRELEEVRELPQDICNGQTAILPIEAKQIWRRSFFLR